MKVIRPKNWNDFQHYKDRSPIWIKLHKKLLDDFEFQTLPVASRALAPMLWLLASEYDGGEIPADTRKLAFRLRMSLEELSLAFEPLLRRGFFEIIGNDNEDASSTLAEPAQVAIPEKEIQVTSNKGETEKNISSASRPRQTRKNALNGHQGDFDAFYAAFPKHEARAQAEKAYVKALTRASPDQLLAGARRYAGLRVGEDRKYTKQPATWLNADCWLDEVPENGTGPPVDSELARLQEIASSMSKVEL